ncbi:MAG TPA: DNA cytosine methyltransferase [Thiobacillus sp.]
MTQHRLHLGHELVIDLFAGGGGASTGIEAALGRAVDIAVNHDPEAVAMHTVNHPGTRHFCESVFKVDPIAVAGHQPVGLLWASPDCTHHSKAKGGKPVSSGRRGLAWVVVKWARRLRPRVIALENVEEFADWGPLTKDGMRCPLRKGQQFDEFKRQLARLGYKVEHQLLRACDYGTPTIRRRLFLIARRDGLPIRWPQPTHGAPDSLAVQSGKLQPWRTAAECIDWDIPAPSIFERKKELAPNTLKRIARGVQRFVLETGDPFIIPVTHTGDSRCHSLHEPLRTITAAKRGEHALVTSRTELVAAFLAKHYGDRGQRPGSSMHEPISTITAVDHHAVVAAHLLNQKGSDQRMRDLRDPAPTVCAGGTHAALVAALLAPYYGQGSGTTGRDPRDPMPTITSKDRLQLVTVTIDGATYVLTDIGMRMLQPRELYRAQGFPDSYIIEHDPAGERFSKAAQVRMCGNSVCPPVAQALIEANFAHEAQIQEGMTA